MKTSTLFWIVVVLIILLGGWYFIAESRSPVSSSNANTSTSTTAVSATFFCDEGTLRATFASSTVAVTFPDGHIETLAQTQSGSGARYEASSTVFWNKGDNAFVSVNGTNTFNNCVAGSVTTSGDASTYTDRSGTFSFSYPSNDDIVISGGDGSYSQDWRANATTTGILLAKATLPASFEPQTNLATSKFTVGVSSDPDAVASCTTASNGERAATSTASISGATFSVFTLSDAGAGNFYQTTSYRTLHGGMCYAIEYTIHSLNIGNFPASSYIETFDQAKVQGVFEQMTQSFTFLQ